MGRPKDGIMIIVDWRHWLGWMISAFAIVGAMLIYLHFAGNEINLSMTAISFGIIFVVEMIVDVIKHLTKLQ